MPYTLEQKRKIIAAHGVNPDEYDIDESTREIVPKPIASTGNMVGNFAAFSPDPSGTEETTVNLPPPKPKPSMFESIRRGVTESAVPTSAGLLTTAGILAALPEPVISKGAAGVLALLGGLGASVGANVAQKKLIPAGVQEDIFLRPEDYQENKYSSILSGFVPGALAMRPSLQDIPDLISGIRNLPGTLTKGSAALTTPQTQALINAGANTIPSAGLYGYDIATGNREFDLGSAAAEILPGLLMTRPTGVGRALGFEAPMSTKELLQMQRGGLEPATPGDATSTKTPKNVRTPKAFLPEESTSTIESRASQDRMAAEETIVPPSRVEIRRQMREQEVAVEAEQNRQSNLRKAGFQQAEAEAEIALQKAETTRLEAESLKQQNEQRKIDLAVGKKTGITPERPVEERLTERVEEARGIVTRPEERPPVNMGEELNKYKVTKASQEELTKPLTEAEQIQEDFDLGRRFSKESDLPPLDRTPIESLKPDQKAVIKKEIARVAGLRRQKVQYVDTLKNAEGKEVLGQYDPKTRTFKLNKKLYAGDTAPHETGHGRILDLLESTSKADTNLGLRSLEFADPQGRKFKTVDEYKKLPENERIAIEENFAKVIGPEGYRRQVGDLYGKKRERFVEWAQQVKNHFKVKLGVADKAETAGHFVERQMNDAPDALRAELAGAKTFKAGSVGEKKEETTKPVVKRSSEESDLPVEPTPVKSDLQQYQEVQQKIRAKFDKGELDDAEFMSLKQENEDIKNRHGGMPPKEEGGAPTSVEEAPRNQEESDLPDTSKEVKDPNYQPASRLSRFFSSATKSVRNLGGETAHHVSDKAEAYFAEKSLNEGLYSNIVKSEITSYPKEVRERVDQYGREMMESNGKEPPFDLTSEEQSLYDSMRSYLLDIKDANTAREIKANPHYWPAILDVKVASMWSKAPNGPEGRFYQNEWLRHARKQVELGRAKYTEDELHEILDDYISAVASGGRESSLTFGALRKAAGLGLPVSMQDNNLLSRFGRYGNRVAKDLAFNKHIESDPAMRYLLRIKNPKTDAIDREIPQLPNGNDIDPSLRGVEAIQNVEKFMYEEFQNNKYPKIQAAARVISSALMGTGTGVRDLVTSPISISAVVGPRNSGLLTEGLKNWHQNMEESYKYGARKLRMNELEFGSAASPDTLTRWFNEVADGFRKYSGRETLEQTSRIYMWGVAKASAVAEIGRAKQGNETSIAWLKKYGNTVDNLDTIIRDTPLDEIPEDVINRISKNVVDRAAGTYDARGLPTIVMDGPLAPFFSLSRWSIEKANTIVEDVLAPARQGNYTPLLTYTLGSFLTGAAIQQLNQLMTSGKRGAEPTLGEAVAADEQQVRAVVNLMQLGSFGGIIGEMMKTATEAYSGNPVRGLSFPLADFVSDNLGQNLTDYFSAIQAGEDKTEASLGLVERMMTQSIQTLRLASYWTWNKDEIERKNSYRDYRLWQEMTGRRDPQGEISRPNELIGGAAKDFKRAKTLDEAGTLLPKAIDSILTKAGKNPLEVIKGFENLKRNSYQTFPTEPVEAVAYYEYLKKSQGEKAASEALVDFLRQREVNKVKSSMVPSLR